MLDDSTCWVYAGCSNIENWGVAKYQTFIQHDSVYVFNMTAGKDELNHCLPVLLMQDELEETENGSCKWGKYNYCDDWRTLPFETCQLITGWWKLTSLITRNRGRYYPLPFFFFFAQLLLCLLPSRREDRSKQTQWLRKWAVHVHACIKSVGWGWPEEMLNSVGLNVWCCIRHVPTWSNATQHGAWPWNMVTKQWNVGSTFIIWLGLKTSQ